MDLPFRRTRVRAMQRFQIGRLVATPEALRMFASNELLQCLERHRRGDWGDLCEEDKHANQAALQDHGRIFSSYKLSAGKLWIITEADRSVTTFLRPEDY